MVRWHDDRWINPSVPGLRSEVKSRGSSAPRHYFERMLSGTDNYAPDSSSMPGVSLSFPAVAIRKKNTIQMAPAMMFTMSAPTSE